MADQAKQPVANLVSSISSAEQLVERLNGMEPEQRHVVGPVLESFGRSRTAKAVRKAWHLLPQSNKQLFEVAATHRTSPLGGIDWKAVSDEPPLTVTATACE